MSKIQSLLEKAGCSPELSGKICETLEQYKETIREQYEAEYQNRINQAKKVCVDETEAHKRELARRTQIWCETKSAAIEAHIAKQSALSESEAVTRLKNIMSLLEGIEPNGDPNGQSTAALEKAKLKIRQVNEDRARAVEVANRQVAIAEKALKANRRLATENAQLKQKLSTSVVAESRQQRNSRRIDSGRSTSQSTTTRQTLLENQVRHRQPRNIPNIKATSNGRFSIGDIASTLDEDLV